MITIDTPKAIELLEQAVARRGADYVDPSCEYDNCQYVKRDSDDSSTPGCIVGVAVRIAGLDLETLEIWDSEVSGLSAISLCDGQEHITFPGVQLSLTAFEAFKAAQSEQDIGKTWGEALVAAKDAVSQQASE